MPKIKDHITYRSTFAPVTFLAVFSILLSIVVVAALMMRPVADDFAYFSDPSIHNPFSFAVHYYFDWTGRFMQALWMSSLYKVFHSHVVMYGTILQLLLLVLSGVFCAYALLRKTNIHRAWVVMIGFGIATFFVYMSPSLFDTNLWITSSSVYLGSAIGLLLSAGCAAYIVTLSKVKWWHYAGLGMIIFLSQLFSEPTSIIMIYMGVIAVGLSYILKKPTRLPPISWIWLGASVAGFLFMYLSPGTSTRQGQLQVRPSIYEMASGAIHSLDKLSYLFTSYRIWLVILVGLVIAPLLVRISTRQRIYILAISLASAFLIPLSLFAATEYTMNGYTPLRALTVPSTLLAFCLVAIVAILLGWLLAYVKKIPSYTTSVVSCVLIVPVMFAAISASIPTLRAVAMRMGLYDTRETSLRQQIEAGQQTITVEPLPLLLDSTEALDMNYNDNTPAWLTDAFHTYYHVPEKVTIVHSGQPRGYCIPDKNPVWFGTKTCAELDASAQSH